MNMIMSLVLLIALLPANGFVQVRIVLVNTEYASIPDDRDYIQHVSNALDYWNRNAPQYTAYEITEVSEIYIANPYSNMSWIAGQGTLDNAELEIYIVANSREVFLQEYAGLAVYNYNAVLVVLNSLQGLEPLLAHELGHILYNLPDFYDVPGLCTRNDIMCFNYKQAYDRDMLGCLTLEYLGGQCNYVYLPRVNTP